MDLKEVITNLIQSKREGEYWDFKRDPHDNNAELLHDILCLSNVIYSGPRYLIIGVSDPHDDCKIVGLSDHQKNRKKQSDVIDFLRTKNFAGNYRPELELKTITISKKAIDVIIIFDNPNKPYYICSNYRIKDKEVKANYIYTRTSDSNTPIDKSADIHIIERMWRQRFGLDLSPLNRLKQLLLEPSDWFIDLGNKSYAYHKIHPEFNIQFSEPERVIEPFGFYYPNETSFIGDAIFKYHNTILYESNYMYCDEMRVELVWPKTAHIWNGKHNWFYYYDLSSLEGIFLYFLTQGRFNFSSRGGGAPFLIFTNQEKFTEFKKYLESNLEELETVNPGSESEIAAERKQKESCNLPTDPIFLGKVEKVYNKWKSGI